MSANRWFRRSVRALLGRSPIIAVALLAFVACAGCGSSNDPEAAGSTRVVQTARGAVTVPEVPKRVVVLSGSLAGYLFDLDAPVIATDPRVLGVSTRDGGFPPSWAEAAQKQGTKALPNDAEINVEAIATSNPDLIIGGGQGFTGPQAEALYDKLSAIAPTVLVPRTAANWEEELRLVADAVGKQDRVEPLMRAYQDKLRQVASSITVPQGKVAYLLTTSSPLATVITPSAALPQLLGKVGFVADEDVRAKAGNPELYGTGDSFQFSTELLDKALDAPVLFVIPLTATTPAQLAEEPLYARLPAFRGNTVFELPATSYRPDYRGAMNTLDLIAERFK